MEDLFGPRDARKIREKYDIPKGFGDCRAQSKAFQTDSIFRCGSRNMTASASAHKETNTYWYHFNHVQCDMEICAFVLCVVSMIRYHFNHVPSWGNVHCSQPDGGVQCLCRQKCAAFGKVGMFLFWC